MRDLPSGTVTLLFTDIEGSTRLLHELGDAGYADALADHRRLLRHAFVRHGGVEVDTQGDAFFVAFADANEAVAAAAEGQEALATGPVRVRMGVHTGEPLVWAEGYAGGDLHRAARVAGAAHGGQVVVSERTAAVVDAPVHDLGLHRLKDLSEPQRLYQLGYDEFPPLKTLYSSNLPVQTSSLVGRRRELEDAGAVLVEHRLLTLLGPGGSGKTRLALQLAADAAERFPDGVWWVPLQAVRDPSLVLPTVAAALGAKDGLLEHLAGRTTLLVLDNVEQVLDAAPELAELMSGAPELRMLVTSREPLRIEGEREYHVEPLSGEDAVRLFRERAVQAEPVGAVVEICRRLDHLPLAIELAAARTSLLGPEQLLGRLTQRLPLLSVGRRDAPARQRTLRATIEWSYELLDEPERHLFARLAVFAGGFPLEAAEQVCGAGLDTLQFLVDKSLVRLWGAGRYGMLETIHEYARERLGEQRGVDGLRRDHASWCAEVLGERFPGFIDDPDRWAAAVDREQDNIRMAIEFLTEAGEAEAALKLAAYMSGYWLVRGNLREAQDRLTQVLARFDGPPEARSAALVAAAWNSYYRGDRSSCRSLAEEAVALAPRDAPTVRGQALNALAVTGTEPDQAQSLLEECLALYREAGETRGELMLLSNLGDLATGRARYQEARARLEEGLALSRSLPATPFQDALLLNLGQLELVAGTPEVAAQRLAAGLAAEPADRSDLVLTALLLGATALARLERHAEAAQLFGTAERLREETGNEPQELEVRLAGEAMSSVERALGPDGYARALTSGRTIPVEEAASVARRALEPWRSDEAIAG